MSDVTETLQDLMERRLKELGKRRGRGESISLREAYQRLLERINDESARTVSEGVQEHDLPPPPTYEVFRRIRNGHTSITDNTASALATMLEVSVNEVYAAAKIAPRLGRFNLPTRADRLDDEQRKVVLSVVDAILHAGAAAAKSTKPNTVTPIGAYDADLDQLPDEADDPPPISGGRHLPAAARRTDKT